MIDPLAIGLALLGDRTRIGVLEDAVVALHRGYVPRLRTVAADRHVDHEPAVLVVFAVEVTTGHADTAAQVLGYAGVLHRARAVDAPAKARADAVPTPSVLWAMAAGGTAEISSRQDTLGQAKPIEMSALRTRGAVRETKGAPLHIGVDLGVLFHIEVSVVNSITVPIGVSIGVGIATGIVVGVGVVLTFDVAVHIAVGVAPHVSDVRVFLDDDMPAATGNRGSGQEQQVKNT